MNFLNVFSYDFVNHTLTLNQWDTFKDWRNNTNIETASTPLGGIHYSGNCVCSQSCHNPVLKFFGCNHNCKFFTMTTASGTAVAPLASNVRFRSVGGSNSDSVSVADKRNDGHRDSIRALQNALRRSMTMNGVTDRNLTSQDLKFGPLELSESDPASVSSKSWMHHPQPALTEVPPASPTASTVGSLSTLNFAAAPTIPRRSDSIDEAAIALRRFIKFSRETSSAAGNIEALDAGARNLLVLKLFRLLCRKHRDLRSLQAECALAHSRQSQVPLTPPPRQVSEAVSVPVAQDAKSPTEIIRMTNPPRRTRHSRGALSSSTQVQSEKLGHETLSSSSSNQDLWMVQSVGKRRYSRGTQVFQTPHLVEVATSPLRTDHSRSVAAAVQAQSETVDDDGFGKEVKQLREFLDALQQEVRTLLPFSKAPGPDTSGELSEGRKRPRHRRRTRHRRTSSCASRRTITIAPPLQTQRISPSPQLSTETPCRFRDDTGTEASRLPRKLCARETLSRVSTASLSTPPPLKDKMFLARDSHPLTSDSLPPDCFSMGPPRSHRLAPPSSRLVSPVVYVPRMRRNSAASGASHPKDPGVSEGLPRPSKSQAKDSPEQWSIMAGETSDRWRYPRILSPVPMPAAPLLPPAAVSNLDFHRYLAPNFEYPRADASGTSSENVVTRLESRGLPPRPPTAARRMERRMEGEGHEDGLGYEAIAEEVVRVSPMPITSTPDSLPQLKQSHSSHSSSLPLDHWNTVRADMSKPEEEEEDDAWSPGEGNGLSTPYFADHQEPLKQERIESHSSINSESPLSPSPESNTAPSRFSHADSYYSPSARHLTAEEEPFGRIDESPPDRQESDPREHAASSPDSRWFTDEGYEEDEQTLDY
eukprot:Gregarina_sp_Poly_1__1899@NODE_1497_length_4001_cov_212_491103_g992_i0_p1_GENE_NODE_1497_length_4001_cov_212_491103_g992_i0NODE_1497_length_4001_cov_212_491103_g992_i0_p1_ORF_typecomplete_len874_score128_03_NODE_1497_length_4001_cov_212_491103_g992_i08703491